MAKNKGPNKKTKNVFKVAGSRSLRLKSKAQKVSTNLKKVSAKSTYFTFLIKQNRRFYKFKATCSLFLLNFEFVFKIVLFIYLSARTFSSLT